MNQEDEDTYRRAIAATDNKYKESLKTMENMRRRGEIAIAKARDQGEERVALLLMDAIDDFQRATDALKKPGVRKQAAIRGIDMALGHLIHKLFEIGIEAVPARGRAFDPSTMEAVAKVPSQDVPHNHVAGQLKAGYVRKGKLLRAAQVEVAVGERDESSG